MYQDQDKSQISRNKMYYLSSLLDNMNELFYTYDIEGKITFMNKKVYDVLGYKPEEVINKYLWDFVDVRYKDIFKKEFFRRINTGKRNSYINTLIHKDGSGRIMQANAVPIIENGQITGEMGITIDVTEQRRAEKKIKEYNQTLEIKSQELMAANEQLMATEEELRQQLDESENNKNALADAFQQLEVLLDFLPDPTFSINLDGQVTVWNRAMEDLTGIKAREMLGRGNYEYAIPFYGKRQALTIDLVLQDEFIATDYYQDVQFQDDTIFMEAYYPQLGAKGTYLATKSSPLLNRKGHIIGAISTMRDITEHKMAEMAIKESEEKYRNIIQSLEDGYFEVDLAGNFNFMNQYMHKASGYAPNEFLGMNYRKIMDEENGKKVMRTFNQVYKTKKLVRELGWYVIRKDGSKLYVESTIMPIIENDVIIGFKGLVRDISDRKKAEDALQNSEKNLRNQVKYLNTLMNNLNELFITYDNKGRIISANKRTYDLLGYQKDEKIGRLITDFVVDEYKNEVMAAIQNRLTYGGDSSYELPLIHKDGKSHTFKLNVSPIIYENGVISGGMILAEDITEEKRAREELAFSEARYRAIVEDQTELICRALPDGTISFVNPAFYRYFNETETTVIGTNIMKKIYKDDRELVTDYLALLSPEQPVNSIEFRVQMSDKTTRWLHCTHRAIYNDSSIVIDYQTVARDITERRLAEDQLKYLSRHDALTDIYNRFHFEEKMDLLEQEKRAPIGLIICDIDGLKLVNDTLGHDAGDDLLRITGKIISRCFRKDDIVARVGGDEFAILLLDSSNRGVEMAVSRMRESIASYNQTEPKVPLSISIGSAIRENPRISMIQLYQEADNNMYKEKMHSGQSARSSIVQTLMKALEARDFMTEGHGDRVQDLVVGMARKLNLDNHKINDLKLFAQFHDIGKVGIPDSILFKKGSLTSEEYSIMKRHCEIGHRIALSAPDLSVIADWILKHHEWWNGKGYPLGLIGEAIPLECRILSIVDAYDAMTNDRPYRRAMSHQKAVQELVDCAGKQFDPVLVKEFISMIAG